MPKTRDGGLITEQEINKIWMFLIPMMGLGRLLLHLDLFGTGHGCRRWSLIDDGQRQEPDHKEIVNAEDR